MKRFEFVDEPTLYLDGAPPELVITLDGETYAGADCNVKVEIQLTVIVEDGPPAGRYKNVSMDEAFRRHVVETMLV